MVRRCQENNSVSASGSVYSRRPSNWHSVHTPGSRIYLYTICSLGTSKSTPFYISSDRETVLGSRLPTCRMDTTTICAMHNVRLVSSQTTSCRSMAFGSALRTLFVCPSRLFLWTLVLRIIYLSSQRSGCRTVRRFWLEPSLNPGQVTDSELLD